MPAPREILLNVSVASFALILTVGGVELALRALGVSPPPPRSATASFVEYDSLLGWRKIPDLTGEAVTEVTSVEMRYNSRGLRSPEYEYEKPAGAFRVLALGDSFAEGYTVAYEHLFSHVLGERLRAEGIPGQVVNAGTRGYSTDQELLFYISEGRRYRPDLTVLLFHGNDVWYNAQPEYPRGPKPLYRLAEGELILTNVPPPGLEPDAGGDALPPPSMTGSAKRWLAARSHFYRFTRDAIKSSRFLHDLAIKAGVAAEPDESVPTIPDVWKVFLRETDSAVERAWRLTEALIVRLRDEVEADGGRFLLFYVPAAIVADEEVWEGTARRYRVGEHGDRDAVRIRLTRIAERHELDFLDPTAQLREGGMDFYVRGEGHWNEAGHRLAAGLLHGWIAETGMATRTRGGSASAASAN